MRLVYNRDTKSFAMKPAYHVMINNKALETPRTLDTINEAIVSCAPSKKAFYEAKGYTAIDFFARKDAEEYEALMKEYVVVQNGFREMQLEKKLEEFKPINGTSILKK